MEVGDALPMVTLLATVVGLIGIALGIYNTRIMWQVRKEYPELAKIPTLISDVQRLEKSIERLEQSLDVREQKIVKEWKDADFASRTQYHEEVTNLTRTYQAQVERVERQLTDTGRQTVEGFTEVRRLVTDLTTQVMRAQEQATADRQTAALFKQAVEDKFEKQDLQRQIAELQDQLDRRTGTQPTQATKRRSKSA